MVRVKPLLKPRTQRYVPATVPGLSLLHLPNSVVWNIARRNTEVAARLGMASRATRALTRDTLARRKRVGTNTARRWVVKRYNAAAAEVVAQVLRVYHALLDGGEADAEREVKALGYDIADFDGGRRFWSSRVKGLDVLLVFPVRGTQVQVTVFMERESRRSQGFGKVLERHVFGFASNKKPEYREIIGNTSSLYGAKMPTDLVNTPQLLFEALDTAWRRAFGRLKAA